MNRCNWCRGDGLVFIWYRGVDRYDLAACQCDRGQWWRTKHQLRAKAATLQPSPATIGRLEEFFSENELRVLETTYEQFDPVAGQVKPRGRMER